MNAGERSEPDRPLPPLPIAGPILPSPPPNLPANLADEHARLTPGLRRMFLARVQGGDDLADDLAQRTWLNVWRAVSANKFDPTRAAFSTFVYAVATNVWKQHLRDTAREKNRDRAAATEAGFHAGNPSGPQPPLDPADAAAELAETLDTLRNAMSGSTGEKTFTEDDRWLLRCIADGASDRELAKRLGVSASTANDRKQSIFRKLRKFLSPGKTP